MGKIGAGRDNAPVLCAASHATDPAHVIVPCILHPFPPEGTECASVGAYVGVVDVAAMREGQVGRGRQAQGTVGCGAAEVACWAHTPSLHVSPPHPLNVYHARLLHVVRQDRLGKASW